MSNLRANKSHELPIPRTAATSALRAAELAGRADVAAWRRDPSALGSLPLGAFEQAPPAHVAARRALLAVRVPPRALTPLVRARGARDVLESYSYWRGVRRAVAERDTWRRLTRGTTILMYHAFAADGESPSRFVVPQRAFRRQMAWLRRRRPVLALDELLAFRREHALPPAGAVVVTIDDGYDDVRTRALPILRSFGLPATLFVPTALLGKRSRFTDVPQLADRPLLTWEATRELPRAGIALGAHTRTHAVLPGLAGRALDAEIAGSRSDLENALGAPVDTFAYPYGKWNDAAADAVERAGFACAVSIRTGRNCPATPTYVLRRTEIHGTDSMLRFVLAVAFGDRSIVERVLDRLRGAVTRR